MELTLEMTPVNFYPRPPRGGRPFWGIHSPSQLAISIHALREEGDESTDVVEVTDDISIHALREEGDSFSV